MNTELAPCRFFVLALRTPYFGLSFGQLLPSLLERFLHPGFTGL